MRAQRGTNLRLGPDEPGAARALPRFTLFDPTLSPQLRNPQHAKLPPTELNFFKAHGILFSGKQEDELKPAMKS